MAKPPKVVPRKAAQVVPGLVLMPSQKVKDLLGVPFIPRTLCEIHVSDVQMLPGFKFLGFRETTFPVGIFLRQRGIL